MRPANRGVRTALAIGGAILIAAIGTATAAGTPSRAAANAQVAAYASAPSLHPPLVGILAHHHGTAPGYWFLDTFKNLANKAPTLGQGGPLILDDKGRPIWIHPVPASLYSLNFEKQTYKGKPALSWWQGTLSNVGQPLSGTYYVVDNHYRSVGKLTGANGWILSMHDFQITPAGTALVTAYKLEPMNLAPYHGPAAGTLLDTAVQEYDIKTGKLVYQWDALGHIALSESYTFAGAPGFWDPYHLNSVKQDSAGHLLISMRNTFAIYQVNKATGAIDWRLGGKQSSYALDANAKFAFQHDAHWLPNNQIALFDDECCAFKPDGTTAPPVNGVSRGLILQLNNAAHTASVVHQYTHSGLVTGSQGNIDVLPNGNVVIGWGQQPFYSEYNQAGTLLYDARWPDPDISYRAFRESWVGLPLYKPSAAARKSKGHITVYASWNGATKVTGWRLLDGSNPRKLAVAVKRVSRRGFETRIKVKGNARFYQVQALDAKGHVLGRSKVVRIKSGSPPPTALY